ncbi:conjugal transfer protein TraF [Geobacter sp. AOG2]|uniref:conjugal transfer protein TraF n=1 Tax=Geobacter sp. AOG2 TaxID=1566347 RepID=UPI001CC6FAED|nr:conjugal transfer protein TraF [Geobacter sp. AOG2]GFE61958.1 hypothetical protein AOG2_25460 [Geobacter sp. AOG2]
MLKRSVVAAVVVLGLCESGHALEFQAVGNGSLGVGGAGVARSDGAMSPYWNPAGLAFAKKSVTVSLTAGAGLQPDKKLAEDMDNMSKAYDAWNNNQADATAQTNLADAVANVSPTDNLRATADAALGVQVKQFGFGVFGTFEGGAVPHTVPVDTSSINAINTTLSQETVTTRGIALIEAPVSYGYLMDVGKLGHVGLGVTGKYLYGEATSTTSQIFDTATGTSISSKDLTKDLSKNRNGSSSWGVDLGAMWKMGSFLPVPVTVAMVGKYLNSPSFKAKNGDKITVDPQVRAGFSAELLSWLDLVGDVDVIKNTTLVPGLKSQKLGGGAEFHPFESLKFRAGGYTDLAESGSGAVTAGFSVGAPFLFLDIDGAYGLGSVRYDNHSYPSEGKVQCSLNMAF